MMITPLVATQRCIGDAPCNLRAGGERDMVDPEAFPVPVDDPDLDDDVLRGGPPHELHRVQAGRGDLGPTGSARQPCWVELHPICK
jgi:hypothetical protein